MVACRALADRSALGAASPAGGPSHTHCTVHTPLLRLHHKIKTGIYLDYCGTSHGAPKSVLS
jgi:hypothetical protein